MGLDTQVVELLGRHRLMDDLLRDNLEVAVPVRDRGVDLIAYADLSHQVASFVARPIQMKAFTKRGFSIAQKHSRLADLIMAYVWNLGGDEPPVTYAMPYGKAVEVAETRGWTRTESWQNGEYTNTKPGEEVLRLLEPYRMTAGKWWALVTAAARQGAADSGCS